mgnify:CR=1 FL=1
MGPWRLVLAAMVGLCLLTPARAAGQQGLGAEIAPGEVERLFEAFGLVQPQDALQLSNEHFPRFVAALNALEELRRERERTRRQLLVTARRLATQVGTADAVLEEHLEHLDAHARESRTLLRAAQETLDAVLDPRQRIRYRFFEQRMERRKLELVMQARGGRGDTSPRRPRAPNPQRRTRPDRP